MVDPGNASLALTDFDWCVRAAVYRHFIEVGAAPSVDELAAAMRPAPAGGPTTVAESLDRLATSHLLELWPRTNEIWKAHPFSGVATDYRVRAGDRTWFASCAWDALAIPGLLGLANSESEAPCPDCGRPVRFGMSRGRPRARPAGAVAHFAVPPRTVWGDIGFT